MVLSGSNVVKIIREPNVYLVGRPAMNEAELARFLNEHDVSHWESDTSVPADLLPEVAGPGGSVT